MNERILASIFEKTLTLDGPQRQGAGGDGAAKSLARIERDMAAVKQGIAGLNEKAEGFRAAGRGGARPFAPKSEPRGGDASAPEKRARAARESAPARPAPDPKDGSDAQKRLKDRQAADAFRKALEGALGAQRKQGKADGSARSADEFQQAVLGRLDAVGRSAETSARLAQRAGRREAFAKGASGGDAAKPKLLRPDATARNTLEAAEESLELEVSEARAAAKRHKELVRAIGRAGKRDGGGLLGKMFGGIRDALFRRAMLRGLGRMAAGGVAGRAVASALAGGAGRGAAKEKPKAGRAAARGRSAARAASGRFAQAGARRGLLGGAGRVIGRAGTGIAAAGKGLLGGVAAAGRGAGGALKAAGRGAGGLLRTGGRLGAGALKLGARAALPVLGLGLAGYDAYKGWNDEKLHQRAFGLKEGQKATTGQKAASAAANLLDMGGLFTGLAKQFGINVDTADIAKAVYGIGSSVGGFLQQNVIPAVKGAVSSIGSYFASGRALQDAKAGLSALAGVGESVWNAVSPMLADAWQGIKNTVVPAAKEAAGAVGDWFASGRAVEDLKAGLSVLGDLASFAWGAVSPALSKAWQDVQEYVSSGKLADALVVGADKLADVGGKIVDMAGEWVGKAWDAIGDWFASGDAEQGANKALDFAKGVGEALWAGAKRFGDRVWEGVKDISGKAFDKLGEKVSNLWKDAEEGIQGWIDDKIESALSILPQMARDYIGWKRSTPTKEERESRRIVDDGSMSQHKINEYRARGYDVVKPEQMQERKEQEQKAPDEAYVSFEHASDNDRAQAEKEWQAKGYRTEWTDKGTLHVVREGAGAPPAYGAGEPAPVPEPKPLEALPQGQTPTEGAAQGEGAKPEAKAEPKPEAKPAEAARPPLGRRISERLKAALAKPAEAKSEPAQAVPARAPGVPGQRLEIPAAAAPSSLPAVPPASPAAGQPLAPSGGLFGDFKSRADGRQPEDGIILAVEDFRRDFQKYADVMARDQHRREERDRRIDAAAAAGGVPAGAPAGGAPAAQGYAPDAGGAGAGAGGGYIPAAASGDMYSVVRKYESGGNAGDISPDTSGSKSYGKYQFNTLKGGTAVQFLPWLQKTHANLYQSLGGGQHAVGSAEYDRLWKQTAQGPLAQEFSQAQDEFFQKSYLQPVTAKLKGSGILEAYGNDRAFQEMLASASVQHGPGGANRILREAYQPGMSLPDFINKVYDYRGRDKEFVTAGPAEAAKQRRRYAKERQDVLAFVGKAAGAAPAPAAQGSAVPAARPAAPASGSPLAQAPAMQAAGAQAASGLSAAYAAATQDAMNRHVRYGFGDKNSRRGSIDCSGWVSEMNRTIFENVADEGAKQRMKGVLAGTSAAGIIHNAVQATGQEFHNADLSPDKIREGMMIGIDHGDKGWDRGRYRGIDHIVQTYRDPRTGEIMVSESTSGKGVTTSRYADWYAGQQRRGAKLYGADVNAIAKGAVVQGGYPAPSGGGPAPVAAPQASGAVSPVRQLTADSFGGTKDASGNLLVHDQAVADILAKILRALDPSQKQDKAPAQAPAPSGGGSGGPLEIPKDFGDPKLEAMAGR